MQFLCFTAFVCMACAISAANVPNIKLNSGHDMPVIGLGTWEANVPKQAVKDAIEVGFRHFDTAFVYGNQGAVGEGINEQIKAGIVKREDVFITTKVWPVGSNEEKSLQFVQHTLKEMNVSYLDLVLVHRPYEDYPGVYKGLEDAYNQKLVRSIGISNFNKEEIDHLMKTAKVKPAVNQIEIHPTLNQDETVDYCKQLGIAVTGYSPLGRGKYIKDATLEAIGKKHNKSAAQVAIRWQIQRNLIVIPKTVTKKYIQEDFEVFDFTLTDEEMKTIHEMK